MNSDAPEQRRQQPGFIPISRDFFDFRQMKKKWDFRDF